MPNDWSDPERASKELARREGRAPSDAGPQEDNLAEILPAMRRTLERLEAETASQTEDIAALAAMLARIDARLTAGEELPQKPQESASGAEIAEAEGRIAAHVDRLADRIEPTARAIVLVPRLGERCRSAMENPLRRGVDSIRPVMLGFAVREVAVHGGPGRPQWR